ncbi:MAG: hypothetical protein A2068_02145 [Ignavibacteria bacterium GWB2_35_6b]|nr:MAG: hypothetical protein A2068_02145 [Ignavibacteria bacterium GWB2_35_6b]
MTISFLNLIIFFFLQDKKINSFPDNSVELFFSFSNPIFISILVILSILLLSYFVINKQFVPLIKEHELEKINIENKYTKSMAMLAEAAPDPVLRVDSSGLIIFANNAGEKLGKNLIGCSLFSMFPEFNSIDFNTFIKNASEKSTEASLNGCAYSLTLKGIPELNAVQIYFSDITAIKSYEEEITASKEKLSELSVHLQTIIETERNRISKELHDGLGQTLSFLKLQLESLKNDSGSSEEKRKILDELNSSINNAVMELKNISYDLKPRLLEIHGLIPALRLMVDQISGKEGIKGTFESFDELKIKPKLEITIFRICQELINNIIKHSKAKNFSIQISQDEESIKLIVDDDGVGFEKQRTNQDETKLRGMGLVSITERVGAFKGIIDIDSSPGNGTVVAIEFPES